MFQLGDRSSKLFLECARAFAVLTACDIWNMHFQGEAFPIPLLFGPACAQSLHFRRVKRSAKTLKRFLNLRKLETNKLVLEQVCCARAKLVNARCNFKKTRHLCALRNSIKSLRRSIFHSACIRLLLWLSLLASYLQKLPLSATQRNITAHGTELVRKNNWNFIKT